MNRLLQPAFRRMLASSMLALLLTACGSIVGPTPIPSAPSATAAPTAAAPGQLHMTAEPAYDYRRLQLSYIVAGSRIEGESIDEDIEIIVNRSFPPGELQVVKDDVTCDGSVAIASNMETDVLLDFGLDAAGKEICRLFTTGTHPSGSIEHPELPTTATIGAMLPSVPSVFVVRSQDRPEDAPLLEQAVDEAPWEIVGFVVQPGRYEASVLVDGARLTSVELDLERGEDRVVNLRALPKAVPRDCGDVAGAVCEPAINAAYAWGLFTEGETVVGVSIEPTKYMSCDSQIAPEWDVLFLLENPKGEIEVTVGRYPDGRLTACTY